MHILSLPSWYPDERNNNDCSGVFFKELAEAFAQKGHKVSVLANMLPFPLNPKKIKDYIYRKTYQTINGVYIYNIKFINWSGYRHLDDSSAIDAAVKWFGKYIKINGYPQIIHASSTFNAGVIALKIKDTYGLPYYLTEHGSWFLKGISPNMVDTAKKVLQNATCYTAVSAALLEKIIDTFHLNPNQGKVIPNILNSSFLMLQTSTRNDNKFIFLNIALDGHNKRRDLLVKAFAQAFRNKMGIELWIGGTANENAEILYLAREVNIERQIKLLGLLTREKVYQAMANCDVFVLSSDVETFGIVLIEALSQGKPIISTDSGGPRDIVNERNGVLVPTDDVNSLSIAMKRVKEEFINYNTEIIRQECLSKYHPDIVINKYMALYQH
jgi:glycosyltransferase involved in cell wall biosynthesis